MARATKLANNAHLIIEGKEYFVMERDFKAFLKSRGAESFELSDVFRIVCKGVKAKYVQVSELSDRYTGKHGL